MNNYIVNHLKELESEAIFILREVASQFERPALLFSGGKDSILLTHLAEKAFFQLRYLFHLYTLTLVIISPKLLILEINL